MIGGDIVDRLYAEQSLRAEADEYDGRNNVDRIYGKEFKEAGIVDEEVYKVEKEMMSKNKNRNRLKKPKKMDKETFMRLAKAEIEKLEKAGKIKAHSISEEKKEPVKEAVPKAKESAKENKEEIKKMQERVADEREKAKKLFGKRGIHRFHSEGKGLSRGGRS